MEVGTKAGDKQQRGTSQVRETLGFRSTTAPCELCEHVSGGG